MSNIHPIREAKKLKTKKTALRSEGVKGELYCAVLHPCVNGTYNDLLPITETEAGTRHPSVYIGGVKKKKKKKDSDEGFSRTGIGHNRFSFNKVLD